MTTDNNSPAASDPAASPAAAADPSVQIAELQAEIVRLRAEANAKATVAARALANYQQRALQMEIIRQQNEELAQLTAELTHAKSIEQENARQVETAYRLKSEFLANFSHELRTPLNAIIGYAELLAREEGQRLTPHGRRDLSTVKNNARTLLALINDILDLSKIEAGHMEVIKESVDLKDLLDECMCTVREQLKGKEVELRTNLDAAAATVFTDPLKLRQILLNLLCNAVKFTEMGEVVATVEARGTLLRVVVEDTGIGIPTEHLSHIFEKFRQVDGSHSRKVGGTGLGLAIVRELARLLDGRVAVRSTLGRGSAFTVEIPDAVPQAPELRTPVAPAEDSGSYPRRAMPVVDPALPRIVYVEDVAQNRELVRRYLEDAFVVVEAADGEQGLAQITQSQPDFVLLDLSLPGIDGWELTRRLKADPQVAHIPVIALSAHAGREDIARAKAAGCVDYLTKPVDRATLVKTLRRHRQAPESDKSPKAP